MSSTEKSKSEPTTPQAERLGTCEYSEHQRDVCDPHPQHSSCIGWEARAVAPVETPQLGTCKLNSDEHTLNTHGPRFPCVSFVPTPAQTRLTAEQFYIEYFGIDKIHPRDTVGSTAALRFAEAFRDKSESTLKSRAEAAEAEVAALRKQQESWRKGTESNMKSMAKLAENLKEELGESLREAAALRERERWIPVSERMPEGEGKFWVWVVPHKPQESSLEPGDIVTANFEPHGTICRTWINKAGEKRFNCGALEFPTHWKALSAAPERP